MEGFQLTGCRGTWVRFLSVSSPRSYPMDQGRSSVLRSFVSPASGSKTSGPKYLSGVRPCVTTRVIFKGLEHQDLVDVYSGCVTGRAWIRLGSRGVRSHCRPRGLRRTLRGVSVCDTKKRRGSPTTTCTYVNGSPRYEAVQVTGRHPYLVTGALVLWSSLPAHMLRGQGVGGVRTSADTSEVLCYLCLLRLHRPSQVRL